MPARKTSYSLLTAALVFSFSSTAVLAHWEGGRPDAHAPIGVMADHTHKKGEWMFSYRAMHMEMDGNRNGKNRLSTSEVLNRFPVAPTNMDMEMHMLGAMYAPNDAVTLNIMVPYVKNSMDHITRTNVEFETIGEGLGDISLGAIFNLASKHVEGATDVQHRLLGSIGVILPTGEEDIHDNAANPNVEIKLPYPMQVGSGTYNLMPGITYLGQQVNGKYSWGAQAMATIHVDTNDEGWSRGDKLNVTGWVARLLSENVSASVRINAQKWDRIDARDDDLTPAMVQTANPSLLAGKRADLSLGLNLRIPGTGHRFAIEVGKPVWQDLDGPQLETDMIVTAGWQWAL